MLNVFLIFTDEKIFLLYTSTTDATTTQQEFTMFINLILAACFPFPPTGCWDLFAIKSVGVHGLVFLSGH